MHFQSSLLLAVALTSTTFATPTPQVDTTGTSVSSAPSSTSTRTSDPDFPLPGSLPYGAKIPGVDYDLIAALKTSPNAVTRIALLKDEQFKFDFADPKNEAGALVGRGGKLVNAFTTSMPALVGNNMGMAVGFTNPCGFNTPHTHPRATELSIVVNGTMISEFVSETGARKVRNVHPTYSMVIFPAGSLHLEFNPNCEPMTFVATFNSEDPGINTPAESLFMLDDELVGLATGLEFLDGADIDMYRHLVPGSLAQGVDACLTKCGIEKTAYVKK